MKILLVGFSRQSASVLALLISRSYPDCEISVMERTFCDNLRLCLPQLSTWDRIADAVIINLDGVGMMTFAPKHITALQNFIGTKAALLIARGDLAQWQSAAILPEDFAIFLNSPYNKEAMTEALEKLIAIAPQVAIRVNEFTKTVKEDKAPAAIQDATPVNNKKGKTLQEVMNRDTLLHQILKRHFDIKQLPLLFGMLDIGIYKGALKVMAGSQTMYVSSVKNVALVSNLQRLIDYCAVINTFSVATNIVAVEEMTNEEFEHIAKHANDYSKYALNTFLWQIYSYILPSAIEVPDHHLLLKMRYMPNFGQMGEVPEYVRHTVATCLVAPHSIEELSQGVGDMQGVDKSLLNRVLLLAILSGTADMDILEKSYQQQHISKDKAPTTSNTGVQKAQKTGFFKRFLHKLTGKS